MRDCVTFCWWLYPPCEHPTCCCLQERLGILTPPPSPRQQTMIFYCDLVERPTIAWATDNPASCRTISIAMPRCAALPAPAIALVCCFLLAAHSRRGELQGYCTNLKNQSQDLGERLERAQISFEKERQGKQEAERDLEVNIFHDWPASSSLPFDEKTGMCRRAGNKHNNRGLP